MKSGSFSVFTKTLISISHAEFSFMTFKLLYNWLNVITNIKKEFKNIANHFRINV